VTKPHCEDTFPQRVAKLHYENNRYSKLCCGKYPWGPEAEFALDFLCVISDSFGIVLGIIVYTLVCTILLLKTNLLVFLFWSGVLGIRFIGSPAVPAE